jgi:hypothetical protein
MEGTIAVLLPIIITLGAFLMIWGTRYLENKENMALIERGLEPRLNRRPADPSRTLKGGMVLFGAGVGLILALTVSKAMGLGEEDRVAIFFGLIAICTGLGMLVAYAYERRNPPPAQ